MKKPKVAILGATGLVGLKFIEILEERNFPVEELRLFASEKSKGRTVRFRNHDYKVDVVQPGCFTGIDIALFSAGGGPSKKIAPQAASEGAIVIDNSSAWRQDPTVPLVVPEVNAEDIRKHQGIIANPNCSTIQMVVALNPIHLVNPIKKIIVATYQSVSGAGLKNVQELCKEMYQWVEDTKKTSGFESKSQAAPELEPKNFNINYEPTAFPYQIGFNLLPHIGDFTANGYTKEEMKMLDETRKIMHAPAIDVSATTIRVPVFYAHSEAVNIELTNPMEVTEAKEILSRAPGVEVIDNPEKLLYPMPLLAGGKDTTYVGRIRKDLVFQPGLALWIVSDNIRKGAATNAIQIAEKILDMGLLKN